MLRFIGGVVTGDGSDSSGDWGSKFLSYPSAVGIATAILVRILNGLGGRHKFFKFRGIIGSYRPVPHSIVGSFESESILTICCPGYTKDDIVIISQVSLPDIFVDLRIISVLGLGELGSLDSGEIGRNFFKLMIEKKQLNNMN